jgi:hypothetical protein
VKKNVASQSIGSQMLTAADGTAFTGAVSVFVTGDNGTQGAGGGTAPAHEGNGYHSYSPTQAETNFDHIAFTFTGTGAIPVTVQVFTSFPQTGDSFGLIGTTGSGLTSLASQASVNTIDDFLDTEIAAILAAVDTEVAAILSDTNAILVDTSTTLQAELDGIQADTEDIQTRLPAALVTGRMDSSVGAMAAGTVTAAAIATDAIDADALAANAVAEISAGITGPFDANIIQINGAIGGVAALDRSTRTMVLGTVGVGSSPTNITTSSLVPAASVIDQFKGRIVIFDEDTTTAALRGQATDITGNTASGAFTVTALTTSPVSGDTFVIV